MFNVLLDKLPTEYKGFLIDSDFQTGIQILQALEDEELTKQEQICVALSLLFLQEDKEGNSLPFPDVQTAVEGLVWFLTDWNHDKNKTGDKEKVADYDIDQWRIYSAFRKHYGINLNDLGQRLVGYRFDGKKAVPVYEENRLHFWEFMGLLTTLPEECAYKRVLEIRSRKITAKMSAEEKKALKEAKKIYALDVLEEELTDEEKEAVEAFMTLVGKGKK